jgi:protein involved in polysaccharide export with SLBB domain
VDATIDVEEAIAAKLQVEAGLMARPDASLQIVRYRPFYVVGRSINQASTNTGPVSRFCRR